MSFSIMSTYFGQKYQKTRISSIFRQKLIKSVLEVRFQIWKHFCDTWAIAFIRLRDKPRVILLRAGPQNNARLKPVRGEKKFADPCCTQIRFKQ